MYCILFWKSLGPQSVDAQCPLTTSLGEFPGYCYWLWYPGLPPVLLSITYFFRLPYFGVFPFTLLHLPLYFIRVSSLRPICLYQLGRLFTYSLFRWVCKLWAGPGTRCCGPRGGTEVRIKHKSRFKFMPWSEFEPRTSSVYNGRQHYH